MNKTEISEKIISIIINMGFEIPAIFEDIDFINDLKFDYLDFADMYVEIEKEFNIIVKYGIVENKEDFRITTLLRVVDYVYQELQKKAIICNPVNQIFLYWLEKKVGRKLKALQVMINQNHLLWEEILMTGSK